MKLSIITPTEERKAFLAGLYKLLCSQTYTNWEWLIYDTSLVPSSFSDSRVSYFHDPIRVTIGEKRNRLIAQAKGEAIVHCDDDDYYAPTYLASTRQQLEKAAFFKFHSWFSYDLKSRQFYYWDTEEETQSRYVINTLAGSCIREITPAAPRQEVESARYNKRGKIGYGFSYSYHKSIAQTFPFPDVDMAEDRKFYEAIAQKGYPMCLLPDRRGEVVHVCHEYNTSSEFPQYRIPRFMMEKLIPQFFNHINPFHENRSLSC